MPLDRKSYPMFIGGKWIEAPGGKTFDTRDPATGELLAKVASGGKDEADQAVRTAHEAFRSQAWSRMDPSERGRLLWKLASLVRANLNKLAEVETLDNGKTLREAKGDVAYTAWLFEYYGGLADKIEGESIPVPGPRVNYTLREPLGVTAHIAPWNYPLLLSSRSIAPALAAGNTVVAKPASLTPLSLLHLAELTEQAGFPPGVFNVVTGGGRTVGEALASHPMVDGVTFTGSVETGRQVFEVAARGIKQVCLELGGKGPQVVFPDADLDKAAKGVGFGIFANAGQMCWAGSRLLVHASVHDDVVARVRKFAEGLRVGPGVLETSQMGPVCGPEQQRRVLDYVKTGRDEGARLATGGKALDEGALAKGSFVTPTIFDGVKPSMRIAREEIFGPVLSVLTFETPEEAVKIANDSSFGLAASVWTGNVGTAHTVARQLESGMVMVNEGPVTFPMTPFGGYKESGLGREQGIGALQHYTRVKNVSVRYG
ncbi:MAG TPA: aldehyde dehydrogenase [Candidatus Thermoplasmatota archaeon]|nr:aldehyde dehydrogenase [Candidatus Thermoplasmatota archaeon]